MNSHSGNFLQNWLCVIRYYCECNAIAVCLMAWNIAIWVKYVDKTMVELSILWLNGCSWYIWLYNVLVFATQVFVYMVYYIWNWLLNNLIVYNQLMVHTVIVKKMVCLQKLNNKIMSCLVLHEVYVYNKICVLYCLN